MTYEEPRDARGTAPIVAERSAAVRNEGGTAADPWPSWAQEQLARAVALHATIPASVSAASVLYREWFNPLVEPAPFTPGRPLAGLYRSAHAASERTRDVGGMLVLGRNDVVGADGWWRTWGAHWTPPRTRPGSVRLFLSPRREHLADVVGTVTELLADVETSWTLGCATDPRRDGAAMGD